MDTLERQEQIAEREARIQQANLGARAVPTHIEPEAIDDRPVGWWLHPVDYSTI